MHVFQDRTSAKFLDPSMKRLPYSWSRQSLYLMVLPARSSHQIHFHLILICSFMTFDVESLVLVLIPPPISSGGFKRQKSLCTESHFTIPTSDNHEFLGNVWSSPPLFIFTRARTTPKPRNWTTRNSTKAKVKVANANQKSTFLTFWREFPHHLWGTHVLARFF